MDFNLGNTAKSNIDGPTNLNKSPLADFLFKNKGKVILFGISAVILTGVVAIILMSKVNYLASLKALSSQELLLKDSTEKGDSASEGIGSVGSQIGGAVVPSSTPSLTSVLKNASMSPKPSLGTRPTSVPSSTPIPAYFIPTSAPVLAIPVISSVSPSSGSSGQEIVIKGYNFGSTSDYVIFCPQGNCSYGAPIVSWNDAEIKARVPGMMPQSSYFEFYVKNYNGKTSNRANFTVTTNPMINSVSPSNMSPALNINLYGFNFGSRGQVNFYKSYPTLSGAGMIESWSSNQIVVAVPYNLEGNTEYDIEVVNGEGNKSSLKNYTVGPKLTMTDYEYPVVQSLEVYGSALYLSTSLTCVPSPSMKIAAGIWDFGDGSTHTFQIIDEHYSSSPGQKENINTGHTYASPGTYTVTGKCKADFGKLSASVSKSITVSN